MKKKCAKKNGRGIRKGRIRSYGGVIGEGARLLGKMVDY